MKPIIISAMMAFLLVQYPYRQGKDAYVVTDNHPVFCSSCEKQFPVEELIDHIRLHDKRKGKADIVAIKDGKTFKIEGFTTNPNVLVKEEEG